MNVETNIGARGAYTVYASLSKKNSFEQGHWPTVGHLPKGMRPVLKCFFTGKQPACGTCCNVNASTFYESGTCLWCGSGVSVTAANPAMGTPRPRCLILMRLSDVTRQH